MVAGEYEASTNGKPSLLHVDAVQENECTHSKACFKIGKGTAERLVAAGFFGLSESHPGEKVAAVITLPGLTYQSYLTQCRRISKGAALRQAKKADREGFYSKLFDRRLFLPDIVSVNQSEPERQGMPMRAQYQASVEDLGGYPSERFDFQRSKCPRHWEYHWGIFKSEPGYKQGDVQVNERLIGYINLRRLGNTAYYPTILGHGEFLDYGIMYRLHLQVMEWLLDPSNEDAKGLEHLFYAGLYQGQPGLQQWKKKMLFQPAQFVLDEPAVGNSGSEKTTETLHDRVQSPAVKKLKTPEPFVGRPDAPDGRDAAVKPEIIEFVLDDEAKEFLRGHHLYFGMKNGVYKVNAATVFEPPVQVQSLSSSAVSVGAFTYSWSGYGPLTEIGRYCSLAGGIVGGFNEHPTTWLTTSSFTYDPDVKDFMWRPFSQSTQPNDPAQQFKPLAFKKKAATIKVGNDVWIGGDAYIKRGVTVGDGAIIGTRSVVTKDVPPFAIVAGNPARIIRYRFSDDIIERIMRTRWWRYSYPEFGGLPLGEVERSLDLLEQRIADGSILPYEPRRITMRWIVDQLEERRRGSSADKKRKSAEAKPTADAPKTVKPAGEAKSGSTKVTMAPAPRLTLMQRTRRFLWHVRKKGWREGRRMILRKLSR